MNELLLRAPRATPRLPDDGAALGPSRAAPTPYWKYMASMRKHWLAITLAGLACALAGFLYASLAPPVYQASMLLQVDDALAQAERVLGEPMAGRDPHPAAGRELEVLRSRLVVARAVDALHLDIETRPRYLPLAGRWLAARSESLSRPGLPGLPGYVWGTERIEVAAFEVPSRMAGATFVLTAGPADTYVLADDALGLRLAGRVGTAARWTTAHGTITLTVATLHARAGAQFLLRRIGRLDSIEDLQRQLRIEEQGKQSGLIRVALEGGDPERLARILNEIGRQYVRQNEEQRAAAAAQALAFFESQLPSLKRTVDDAESNAIRQRRHLELVDAAEQARDLLRQTAAARARLADLEQKRAELTGHYGGGHPALETADRQIEAVRAELAALAVRIRNLPQAEQDVARLDRDARADTEVYTAVLASVRQLRLASASRTGNTRLLDPAEVPLRPLNPAPAAVAGVCGLIGLLLSTLAACARSREQWRAGDPHEIERQFGLPLAATVPLSSAQRKLAARIRAREPMPGPGLLQLAAPDDAALEGLRCLRALLQQRLADADARVVVFAAPRTGAGASFVAANLAGLLAAAGRRVLLVDADLRGGMLHRLFATAPGAGLSDYLDGQADAQAIVHMEVAAQLDLVPAGTPSLHPCELLARTRLRELLASAARCYDYVLVDSAPVLPWPDALAVAPLGALTLAVVGDGISSAADIAETLRLLRQAGAHADGLVVNAAPRGGARGRVGA